MKTKTLMIALVAALAILLGGLFLLKGLDLGETEEPVTEENITLAQIGTVTAVEQSVSGTAVSYEVAETGAWVCMQDDTLELDQNKMASLAAAAAVPVASQLVTDDAGRLSDFGLEDGVTVTVTGSDGSYTIRIGDYLEFNGTYYVQMEDQPAVYTVPAALAELLCAAPEELAALTDWE